MQKLLAENIDKLAGCTVSGEDGEHLLLGSYWEGQRAALVFVRHFG